VADLDLPACKWARDASAGERRMKFAKARYSIV